MINILGGCASNMTGYYSNLRQKIYSQDYQSAAKYIDNNKSKYGKKNILMYYLDSGIVNHYAYNFSKSIESFELAKNQFEDNYQKSVSAKATSIVLNDKSQIYFGKDFERAYMAVFESLDFVLQGYDDEAVVEARQIDTLFKGLSSQKSFYNDDGFIRYFMGLIYENAGELSDANTSYYLALKAYEKSKLPVKAPQDLINDAYTTSLKLGFNERANKIKSKYPNAQKIEIPTGYAECVFVNYNGLIAQKVEKVFEFALTKILPYLNYYESTDDVEQKEYELAKSVVASAVSNDYIKVSFPKYKRNPNNVENFCVKVNNKIKKGYIAQNISDVAESVLEDETAKVYIKEIARATVKYLAGKALTKYTADTTNKDITTLTQIVYNLYLSFSESADTRAWNMLPDSVMMAKMILPQGKNTVEIVYLDKTGNIIDKYEIEVEVQPVGKNFIIIKS